MTLEALQKKILKKLASVVDRETLERINQIIDESTQVYILSEPLQEKLKAANEDLENGNFIDGDEMNKRVAKWLNEK